MSVTVDLGRHVKRGLSLILGASVALLAACGSSTGSTTADKASVAPSSPPATTATSAARPISLRAAIAAHFPVDDNDVALCAVLFGDPAEVSAHLHQPGLSARIDPEPTQSSITCTYFIGPHRGDFTNVYEFTLSSYKDGVSYGNIGGNVGVTHGIFGLELSRNEDNTKAFTTDVRAWAQSLVNRIDP